MLDRGKVINDLRSIKTYLASQAIESTDDFAREGFIESQKDIDDALALLKEQEAVEPKKVKGYNPPMYTFYEYECEKCKSPMMNKQPFCMGCGRSVSWK